MARSFRFALLAGATGCLLCSPARAQVCYQFSDAAPGGNPTFTAKVSIASIPPSQPTTPPELYGASFTTYPSGVNSSPEDTVVITTPQGTFTFNTFSMVISSLNPGNPSVSAAAFSLRTPTLRRSISV